jgi:thioredoxin 1
MATVITKIKDREEFQTILNNNEGIIILKFGAEWCKPCKLISPFVKDYINKLPSSFTVYDLDVDENFEIYAYLQHKKMVSGIPILLAYYRENKTYASDQCISGVDKDKYKTFFMNCIAKMISYK